MLTVTNNSMGCGGFFCFFLASYIHTFQQTGKSKSSAFTQTSSLEQIQKKTSFKDLLVLSQHHSECGMGHSGHFGIVPADHLSSCKHCLQMHRLQEINSTSSQPTLSGTVFFLNVSCTHTKITKDKANVPKAHIDFSLIAFTVKLEIILALHRQLPLGKAQLCSKTFPEQP